MARVRVSRGDEPSRTGAEEEREAERAKSLARRSATVARWLCRLDDGFSRCTSSVASSAPSRASASCRPSPPRPAGADYQKSPSSSPPPPLRFLPGPPPPLWIACRRYASAICSGSVDCSASLSSRMRMKRGKRSEMPRSPHRPASVGRGHQPGIEGGTWQTEGAAERRTDPWRPSRWARATGRRRAPPRPAQRHFLQVSTRSSRSESDEQ